MMTTSQSFRLDPATEADVPVVLRLIKGLAEYERLLHVVTATEEGLRESLFREPRAADAVIARVDGEAVGYALWFPIFSTFLGQRGLYLEDLFVVPQARGRGIGRALLAHVATQAVARGCGRVEWSVLDWNEPAIRFYQSLGALSVNDWTLYRLAGNPLRDLAATAGV